MAGRILVREMQQEDEYFVGTCSHTDESEETDDSGVRRQRCLERMKLDGARVYVGFVDKARAGFIHTMPIELSPWGPIGRDLLFVPCLLLIVDDLRRLGGWVLRPFRRKAG